MKEKIRVDQQSAAVAPVPQVTVAGGKIFLTVKRIFDIFVAFIGLAVLFIPMIVIGVL